MFDRVVKISVLSAPMQALTLKKASTEITVRPQMNVLIVSPFGSGKTTMLQDIEQLGLGVQIRDYTKAGLLFTISHGRLIKGSVFKGARKCILIDEFSRISPHLRDLLLDLLEEQISQRSIGKDMFQYTEEGEGYKIEVDGTWCKIKVQASWIITTMSFKKKRYEDIALISRCFPIYMQFDEEDAFDLIRGRYRVDFSNVKRHISDTRGAIVEVKEEHADIVMEAMKNTLKLRKVPSGYITRMFWDTLRIAAVYSCIDGTYETTKEHILEACRFLPAQATGFSSVSLKRSESIILSAIAKYRMISAVELREATGLSRETIKRAISRLRELNLIEPVHVGSTRYYRIRGDFFYGEDDNNNTAMF